MSFKEVRNDPAISLGGMNKKTNRPNPTSIEGYYLRSRKVPDNKKKSGFGFIHEFEVEKKGLVSVWGKTNLDNKMKRVPPGVMTRVTHTGKTEPTANGDMQIYLVEQDESNTIEVAPTVEAVETSYEQETNYETVGSYEAVEETGLDDEDTTATEAPPARAQAPRQPARVPSAASQAKVQELLSRNRNRTS